MSGNLASVVDDLRYMNRLTVTEFCKVFGFKTCEDGHPLFAYEQGMWRLFLQNPLHLLWRLDPQRLEGLENWIAKTKEAEQ